MKLADVITKVNLLKENSYGDDVIIDWCSDVDQSVAVNIMKLCVEDTPARYTSEFTGDLLVSKDQKDIFSRIYIEFCMAKLSQLDEDPVNYANYMTLYNNTWKDYAKWYVRISPARESKTINVI